MKVHAQLLRQSVTAPRAAFDLAVQHPNTYALGWIYVGALAIASFILDVIFRSLFPQNYIAEPTSSLAFAWLNSVWAVAAVTALIYVFSYVFLRWFWRLTVENGIPQSVIDGAIAVSFACSIVFLLPQYLILDLFAGAAPPQIFLWTISVCVALVISSFAFQHAFNMTYSKALCLNVMANVLLFVAVIVLIALAIFAWALATGTGFDQLFGLVEGTQESRSELNQIVQDTLLKVGSA